METGLQYAFTPATQDQIYQNTLGQTGTQLFNTPLHSGVGFLQASLKGWLLSTQLQYTGLRYTSEDNLYALPAYALLHGSVSRSFSWRNTNLVLLFNLTNITNTRYQSILNRALPGRNYNLTLKIFWNNQLQ
jgi:iron complex outermembrane receptor protein